MLYVGEADQMLKERDEQRRTSDKDIIYKYEFANGTGNEGLKNFVVTCIRKDLDDEDQRFMMEALFMLKLGTLKTR